MNPLLQNRISFYGRWSGFLTAGNNLWVKKVNFERSTCTYIWWAATLKTLSAICAFCILWAQLVKNVPNINALDVHVAKLMAQEWPGNTRIALTTTSRVIWILPLSWSAQWRIEELRGTFIYPHSRPHPPSNEMKPRLQNLYLNNTVRHRCLYDITRHLCNKNTDTKDEDN